MKGAIGNKLLALLFLCMVAGHFILAFFTLRSHTLLLFGDFALLFGLYAAICKYDINAAQLKALLAGSILLRIIWLPAFPQLSDDYARFVWDGRLLAAGYNPFNYLPSELMKGHLPPSSLADPKLYAALNSPDYFTIYPPLLQGLFGISSRLFPQHLIGNIIALRLFIVLAEGGSLYLLVKLCAGLGIDRRRVLLYALNPMIIAELTGNLHFEAIVIFFLLGTFYCWQQNRFVGSILLFTGAVVTKLVPLIFLPLVFFYLGWKRGFVFCISVLVLFCGSWAPFIDATLVRHVGASVNLYFQSFEFNAGIYYLVRDIVFHYRHEVRIEIIGPVLSVVSTALMLLLAIMNRKKVALRRLPALFIWTLLIYLSFATMVHPWYITPLIVFSLFTTYRFPLIWSAIIISSYYEYHAELWNESNVQLWIEYLMVGGAVICDLYHARRTVRLF